jgi:hypothetical protein
MGKKQDSENDGDIFSDHHANSAVDLKLRESDETPTQASTTKSAQVATRSEKALALPVATAPLDRSSDDESQQEPGGPESFVTKIKIYPVTSSAFRPPAVRSDSRTVSVISISSGRGPRRPRPHSREQAYRPPLFRYTAKRS